MAIFKSTNLVSSFVAGDLTTIKELLHPKNDNIELNYSLAHAVLEPESASEPHILQTSSELYYILEGNGRAYLNEEAFDMKAGDFLLIPAGVKQHIQNTGTNKLSFLCVVSPPWAETDELILQE